MTHPPAADPPGHEARPPRARSTVRPALASRPRLAMVLAALSVGLGAGTGLASLAGIDWTSVVALGGGAVLAAGLASLCQPEPS